MKKVRARISQMSNRYKLVVESSGKARYSNIEEEIEYFGVSLKYAPVQSILTPTGGSTRKSLSVVGTEGSSIQYQAQVRRPVGKVCTQRPVGEGI